MGSLPQQRTKARRYTEVKEKAASVKRSREVSAAADSEAGQLVRVIEEPSELLPYLFSIMPDKGRNKVKAILTRGQVLVEGRVTTQHNFQLGVGQTVRVNLFKPQSTTSLHGVRIVYEDAYLLVVDKDAGLLSIATEEEKYATAYRQLQAYVQQGGDDKRIFIVHRLDRDTSGLMMFAKSEDVKEKLQDNWKDLVAERVYTVLVEGRVRQPQGVITSWLKETKTMLVYSSLRPGDGDKAVTHFTVLKAADHCTLLEARLETGRKNQIRVHMKDLGHPVVGDKRYGGTGSPIGRLGLHARILSFRHPISGEDLHFETPVPPPFLRYLERAQPTRRT
ncbi:MAG: RluA family pseudouridine synthase [Firmicutes bacterium]|nr:RluA family pseudouridine synthase [Bacillota bacterium]